MNKKDLPDDVRRFILTSVPSVPYLEAILLLRAEPDTAWPIPAVARRLYLAEPVAAQLLQALAGAGIARTEPGAPDVFLYRPASPELAAMLDAVAGAYSANLVQVTDLIHSRVDRRAQQFADAFRWRKDA
ncbi:hypothetical protein [Ramlibacter sp.]|uniref:hypothetical protein n=1 Tax=Ramlibacter sp. TaxID=1917967 RepID=UPI002CE9C028|nr:hypothetical protein [Ramlibacter sp.]HWI81285.1 hypothetical protein [Ramlibacter sp.]